MNAALLLTPMVYLSGAAGAQIMGSGLSRLKPWSPMADSQVTDNASSKTAPQTPSP